MLVSRLMIDKCAARHDAGVSTQRVGSSATNFILQPWHLLVASLAGWVNHRQQEVIDYLRTENQILKEFCRERLGGMLRYYYRAVA